MVKLRWFVAAATIATYFLVLGGMDLGPIHLRGLIARGVLEHARAVDITKVLIAVTAAVAVVHEQRRGALRRPIADRWRRFVAVLLGLSAIVAYFGGGKSAYPGFWHRWDQYHYYVGAKYFRELRYDGLYHCTLIAEDEIGVVRHDGETRIGEGSSLVDMRREARNPEKKIRDLAGDKLLVPAADLLARPEVCKARFSPERWESYKRDVAFFRVSVDRPFWDGMQRDHGYNPPPVWTILGWAFASMFPAGRVFDLPLVGAVVWTQLLALLDVAYLGAMLAAIGWAFGLRVLAVSAIVFGCQAAAPSYWTEGALLRQDWLFWLVFSVCLAKKRWFVSAGAALAYATLLRVFPGLVGIGLLAVAGVHFHRRRRLARSHARMIAGGALAVAVLVPLSLGVAGKDAYHEFYRHTLVVHDKTPLTNHMGLRVLVSQKVPFEIPALGVGMGPASGRMKHTKDNELVDPFEVWKRMRNERYQRLRPIAWLLTAIALVFFVRVARTVRSPWLALSLAQVFMILMAQLTCYYYSFVVLLGLVTRARRQIEAPLFGLLALSQIVWMIFYWFDDRYWTLSAIFLVFSLGVLGVFMSAADRDKVACLLGGKRPKEPRRSTRS